MGLAASQARMLFITARKSDVEFSQMKIASNKISLARETEDLSDEYNRSLNMRKLTFAMDGGATSSNQVDLSYDLLMSPNSTNVASQYMITDINNRVVLSEGYVAKLGLSGDGGNIGAMDRNAFLAKFGIDGTKFADANVPAPGPTPPVPVTPGATFTTKYDDSKIISNAGLDAFYSGSSRLMTVASSNGGSDFPQAEQNLKATMKQWFCSSDVSGKLASTGTIGAALMASMPELGSAAQAQVNAAMVEASNKTYNLFIANESDTGNNIGSDRVLGMAAIHDTRDGHSHTAVIDAKVLIDAFLTYFDQACAKFLPAGTASKEDSVIGSNIISKHYDDTPRKTFTRAGAGGTGDVTSDGSVKPGTKPVTPGSNGSITDSNKASFYTNLFYAIRANGWSKNSNITNTSYLSNQLINNNLRLQKINSDGTWSPATLSDPSSPIRNVRDTEGAADAKAKYDLARDKINDKDSLLDIQMKNLETERSALDTEVDSVKGIIQKNIERSFKTFA